MNDIVDRFFEVEDELNSYFGYVPDWVAIPYDDARTYYWELDQNEDDNGEVNFALSVDQLKDKDAGDYYSNEIYTQRFLSKWVYYGEKYTMIVVDTHVDGNKFLQIFSNDKRVAS